MVAQYTILPHLLNDWRSFNKYREKKTVSFDEIKRNLYHSAREINTGIPDRYYKLQRDKELEGIDTLSLLLSKGIGDLAASFLELHGNTLSVKPEKMNEWQTLITQFPSIVLSGQFLLFAIPFFYNLQDVSGVTEIINSILNLNFAHSTILSPNIPQLHTLSKERHGFSDLHIHINGTIEPPWVWIDALASPDKFCKNIENRKAFIELLEQVNGISSVCDLHELLVRSRELRSLMWTHLAGNEIPTKEDVQVTQSAIHPFQLYFRPNQESAELLAELAMYLLVGRRLLQGDEKLASLFHEYLINMAFFIHLLMQQPTQYGFEQFQKLTLTNLRDLSEESYKKQFLQLTGSARNDLHYVECRFNPKPEIGANITLLAKISKGWEEAQSITNNEGEYALVAHFIKRKDSSPDTCWRFQAEYSDLCKRASALLALIHSRSKYAGKVVGIDAAGSEFDMPPYVFSPFFRALKRKGVTHATYHAGEDFYQILGGLRAIYEAIEFCGLSRGDRIGHASAAGLNPDLFSSFSQGAIPIEESLDNLVFAYSFITEQKIKDLYSLLPLIASSVEVYCLKLYGKDYPIPSLIAAWRLRRFHPTMVYFEDCNESEHTFYYDEQEVAMCSREREGLPLEIYLAYQDSSFAGRRRKEIVINEDILSTKDLVVLQQALLKFMHSKEIVIETLPSSNVSIGPHKSIDSYHLWTWLQWERDGKCIPPIVVGTDDPGIFPTTIFNEYARIYCHLVYSLHYSYEEALKTISRFENNARIYSFYDGAII
jgi:adenosine deaminase